MGSLYPSANLEADSATQAGYVMATAPKPRTTQAKIKHEILDRYLSVWGRIIVNGLREHIPKVQARGRPFELHFVYVDCNAFRGQYPGELEDFVAGRAMETVYGSPVIGVQALDRLAEWAKQKVKLNLHVNAVLIELNKKPFRELQESLTDAGFADRVRLTCDFSSLRNRDIAVAQADWTTLVDDLVCYTQTEYTYSFYLLDPYGPMAIPLSCAGKIVKCQRHDVMINMPYQDLLKKTGLTTKDNLSPGQQELCDHYDRMFGSQRWRDIVQNHQMVTTLRLASGELSAVAEEELAQGVTLEGELAGCYRDALRSTDGSLAVKKIKLHFPDRQRTMYYLYLTTHDPSGALRMNKILHEAGQHEYGLRERLKHAKKERAHGMSMLPGMFEIPVVLPTRLEDQRPEIADIADHIVRMLDGRQLERPQIYQAFADELYFADEINKAVTQLKREGRAHYDGPQNDKGVLISIGRAVSSKKQV